jgi:hypothetical protein
MTVTVSRAEVADLMAAGAQVVEVEKSGFGRALVTDSLGRLVGAVERGVLAAAVRPLSQQT